MKFEILCLKLAVILSGIFVIILSITGIIGNINDPVNPDYTMMLYPILIGMYISVVPFFIALYQTYRILSDLEKNQSCTERSLLALKRIQQWSLVFSGLYILITPFMYLLADQDDAPGLIIFGMIPIAVSLVISVFASLLRKIIQTKLLP